MIYVLRSMFYVQCCWFSCLDIDTTRLFGFPESNPVLRLALLTIALKDDVFVFSSDVAGKDESGEHGSHHQSLS